MLRYVIPSSDLKYIKSISVKTIDNMINKKLLRLFFALTFLLQAVLAFGQQPEIIKILKNELQKEVHRQVEDSLNYRGNRFEIVENFSIKDSVLTMPVIDVNGKVTHKVQTDLKILTIKIKTSNDNSHYVENQEIELKKIIAVIKDINIIFETEPNAVKITRISEDGTITTSYSNLFFLYLSYEKQNEYLADEIVKALKKIDISIKKGGWYD